MIGINILLIVFIILLFFFMSNEKKVDEIISKKNIKFILLLLIIYFIYQNYNIGFLVILILIFIFFNTDLKEKILNNKYIRDTYESFSNEYDIKPYISQEDNVSSEDEDKEKNINKIEPFKNEVLKLKDLYDNIKLEIEKLGT